jgi:hypothetical protein
MQSTPWYEIDYFILPELVAVMRSSMVRSMMVIANIPQAQGCENAQACLIFGLHRLLRRDGVNMRNNVQQLGSVGRRIAHEQRHCSTHHQYSSKSSMSFNRLGNFISFWSTKQVHRVVVCDCHGVAVSLSITIFDG